jgi:hypothetical protein
MKLVIRAQGARNVGFVRLDFLQAHDVRFDPAQPAEQTLAAGRTDAVGVQGDDAEH